MNRRLVGLTIVLFVAIGSSAFVAPHLAAEISSQHALGATQAYWHPEHALRLYVVWPIVAVTVLIAFLAPGLAFTLAQGATDRAAPWLCTSMVASIGASVLAVTLGKVFGTPLSMGAMLSLWAAMTAAGLGVAARRSASLPIRDADLRRMITWIGLAVVLSAALVPMLFWSDLTSDGVEAFEFSRSLSHSVLPRFDLSHGGYGFYIKFFVFAYPGQFFQNVLGSVEVGSRLPFVLYGLMIAPAVVAIVEGGARRLLTAVEDTTLTTAVVLYLLVQAYTSTYEPFLTDLAEPSATDTLWILLFLIACWALFAERYVWFAVAALLNFGSSAGGLLLLLCLAPAVRVFAPVVMHRHFKRVVFVVIAAGVLAVLHRVIVIEWMLGGAKNQFGGEGLMSRLIPPNPFQFDRLAFLIVPSGILPAVSMIFVRRSAPRAWVLTVVCLAYFGVIYMQAWTGIHQFTPAMILPLVIFWRLRVQDALPKVPIAAVWAGLAVAFVVSLPRHFEISQGARAVGLASDYRIGRYHEDLQTTGPARELFYDVLREDYRICYPRQPWGADPFALLHYAHRDKGDGAAINYVFQEKSAAAPVGAFLLAERGAYAVYVRDRELWQKHRNPGFPKQWVPAIYDGPLAQSFAFFRKVAGFTFDKPPCVDPERR